MFIQGNKFPGILYFDFKAIPKSFFLLQIAESWKTFHYVPFKVLPTSKVTRVTDSSLYDGFAAKAATAPRHIIIIRAKEIFSCEFCLSLLSSVENIPFEFWTSWMLKWHFFLRLFFYNLFLLTYYNLRNFFYHQNSFW